MNVLQPGEVFGEELSEIGRTLANDWSTDTGQVGEEILRRFYATKGSE